MHVVSDLLLVTEHGDVIYAILLRVGSVKCYMHAPTLIYRSVSNFLFPRDYLDNVFKHTVFL